jgi:methylenetetrahydrofolate dehydrogenase (NADP+)/methenyltetrahydrofolate cyclohydrolase
MTYQTNPVILDGKTLAAKIRGELKERSLKLQRETGKRPMLATILVGSDPASATYVKMKGRACESCDMDSRRIELPETTTTDELLAVIDELNADDAVDGILLQHPVPSQIDERLCFDRILPEKDVDGVTTLGFGRISFGLPAYPSCTPAGIMRLLAEYNIPLQGRRAVVIGRSPILGRPLAALLLQASATVTVCHSKTANLPDVVREGDLVFACVGKPNFVKGDWLKQGVVLVDAGYNEGNVGDADYESCYPKCSYITPVPGGVGPVTIAMLLSHTVAEAERKGYAR